MYVATLVALWRRCSMRRGRPAPVAESHVALLTLLIDPGNQRHPSRHSLLHPLPPSMPDVERCCVIRFERCILKLSSRYHHYCCGHLRVNAGMRVWGEPWNGWRGSSTAWGRARPPSSRPRISPSSTPHSTLRLTHPPTPPRLRRYRNYCGPSTSNSPR